MMKSMKSNSSINVSDRQIRFATDWLSVLLILGVVASANAAGVVRVDGGDKRANAEAKPAVVIFNGRDLNNWQGKSDKKIGKWNVVGGVSTAKDNNRMFEFQEGSGIFVNGKTGRTINLFTQEHYGDIEAHIEFVVPKGSNSGIYFQGRYEIQVLDSWGVKKPTYGDCGGIYQRWKDGKGYEGHPPQVNASKAPGEWQSFDIVFLAPRFDKQGRKVKNARFVKVVHNGKLIHENVEVTGPTRAGAFNDEKPLGPIMLQGDHGPVAFRNMKVRPLNR